MSDPLDDLYAEFGDKICLFPFLGLYVTTWSYDESRYNLLPCTIGTTGFNPKDTRSDVSTSMIDAYNREAFVNLRKQFLEGKGLEHQYCKWCKADEDNGAISSRKMNNQHIINNIKTDAIDIVRRVQANSCRVKLNDIAALDYMPSNYCNQACVMCNQGASSKRGEFLRRTGLGFSNKIETSIDPVDLNELLGSVRLLNFTGGETLIQPQVVKAIDTMISTGAAKKASISVLTNLSKYDQKLISKLEQFENCFMTCSIDGTGKVVEYQRIGAKWEELSANMISLVTNHPKIKYVINYVVTAISATGIPDMIRWCKENNIAQSSVINDDPEDHKFLIFSPVRGVKYLQIDVLPPSIVDKLISELEEMKQLRWTGYEIMIDDAISFLRSHKHDPILTTAFKSRMAIEDAARDDGLTYKDIFGDSLDG